MVEVVTDRESFLRTAADAPPGARVPVEARVTVPDPFDAYRRARDGPGGVYLDTTGGQSGWGYFATAPVDFIEANPGEGALDALATVLDGETLVRGECDVPYPCGAIGWLSYDAARELETLPDSAVRDRDLPRLQVATYDRIATWERPADGDVTLRITACPRIEDSEDRDALGETYRFAREHARELAREATEGDPAVGPAPVEADSAHFQSDCTREAFAERVRQVKEYIRDGDTFQANVSQRLRAPAAVHPVEAFDALREVNPAPYSALLEFPGVDLVSATERSGPSKPTASATATASSPNPSPGLGHAVPPRPKTSDWKRTCWPTRKSAPNTRCSSTSSATTWGRSASLGLSTSASTAASTATPR